MDIKDLTIGYSFIAHVGFALMDNEEKVDEFLTEIYKVPSKSVTHAQMMSYSTGQYTTKTFSTENFGEFSSVSTIVIASSSRILDVVTISILSEGQIQGLRNGDRLIADLQHQINFSFMSKELYFNNPTERMNDYPIITYMSPNDYFVLYDENGVLLLDESSRWIEDNIEELRKFGFNNHGLLTHLRGERNIGVDLFIVEQSNSMNGPFSILSAGQFHKFFREQRNEFNFMMLDEVYKEISSILNLMRNNSWLLYRRNELHHLDIRTYSLLGPDLKFKSYSKLLEKYNNYEVSRVQWIELANRIYDELEGLRNARFPVDYKIDEYTLGKHDFQVKKSHGTFLVDKPSTIVFLFLDVISASHADLQLKLKVIEKKIDNLSNFFTSSIGISSIKHSRFHTAIMTIMTIIILVATIVALFSNPELIKTLQELLAFL